MKNTRIVWLTGLSGSGKTTIANRISDRLVGMKKTVLVIDGDNVRNSRPNKLTFRPEDIRENNRLIALQCRKNIGQYDFIIVSLISPFRDARRYARQLLQPHFIEVFVKADLQECIRRDVKGLYGRALAGQIENFIGISVNTPYEEPSNAEIVVDTVNQTPDECVTSIIEGLSTGNSGAAESL
jgi:adenylyl-sulfate kinase